MLGCTAHTQEVVAAVAVAVAAAVACTRHRQSRNRWFDSTAYSRWRNLDLGHRDYNAVYISLAASAA
jgi:hypothetical protein